MSNGCEVDGHFQVTTIRLSGIIMEAEENPLNKWSMVSRGLCSTYTHLFKGGYTNHSVSWIGLRLLGLTSF